MKFLFTPEARDDYLWWQQNDRAALKRLNRLIEDICRNGYEASASPSLSGRTSRASGHAASPPNTALSTPLKPTPPDRRLPNSQRKPTLPLLTRLAGALDAALTIRLDDNDSAFVFTPHHGPRPGEPATGGHTSAA